VLRRFTSVRPPVLLEVVNMTCNSVYSGREELAERVKQLRMIIRNSEKHGSYVSSQIEKLKSIADDLENILDRQPM